MAKRLWVQLPVGEHAWVACLIPSPGAVPCLGVYKRQLIDASLSDRCFFLSLSLSIKTMKKRMSSGEDKNICFMLKNYS